MTKHGRPRRSPVTTRQFPWIPILFIVIVLSFLGNIVFVYHAYERSRVVSVPDGDSLQLKDGRRVRLLGIDAPELGSSGVEGRGRCMADQARDKLVDLAQGRHVRLKETVTDDYGRTLAIAIVEDWKSWLGYLLGSRPGLERGNYPEPDPLLQRALVSAGLARNTSSASSHYNRVLKDAQEIAKSNKLGIWSDECRGETQTSDDCTIKGNTRAGKKFYYTPDCPTYDQVIVDRAFGDAWYCTESEANKAGFSLASSCK